MTKQAIDAVITWVDGSDPNHQQKLSQYLKSQSTKKTPKVRSTRFSDDGEIEYCVQSILKFAPWIRNIYIVTDQQTPALMVKVNSLKTNTRITVIDHRDIFQGYEEFLPTFNTRTIVNMIWRIPNLSEQFLFFNDDFLLCQPMQPDDFFKSGKVVLRGKWHLSVIKNLEERFSALLNNILGKPVRPKHSTSQRLAARVAGFQFRNFMVRHNPHPFLKSTWSEFFLNEPGLAKKQLRFKLRSAKQYNVDALSAHLNIKKEKACFKDDIPTLIIQPDRMSETEIASSLKKCFDDQKKNFLCIQSLDKASDLKKEMIFQVLDKYVGNPFKITAGLEE